MKAFTSIFLLALLPAASVAQPAPVSSCGCLPTQAAIDTAPAALAGMAAERALRDYALFSYRNIAAAVIAGEGIYLDTLTALFLPVCAAPPALIAWLREILANAAGPADFARRLAVAQQLALRCAPARLSPPPAVAAPHPAAPPAAG